MHTPPADFHFDDARLASYAMNNYGYGSWDAPVWFVGLEEGGGEDPNQVARKVDAWHRLGARELSDLYAFHVDAGITQWFGERARIQTTWGKYSRLALLRERASVTPEDVRRHQADVLGRPGLGTCMIEVMPLPCPNEKAWHYDRWSSLPQLASRELYRSHYLPVRALDLPTLRQVDVGGRSVLVAVEGKTRLVVMHHPAAMGVTNEYFNGVAALGV